MSLITYNTRESLFSTFSEMSQDDFQKELQSILSARDAYLENGLFDSSVFSFLDEVFEVVRDVLVYKSLPG